MRRIRLPDEETPLWARRRRTYRNTRYILVAVLFSLLGYICGRWQSPVNFEVLCKCQQCKVPTCDEMKEICSPSIEGDTTSNGMHVHGKRSVQEPLQTPVDLESLPVTALEELHYALQTMQTRYFELWVGTWPDSIDWTGAVIGTFVTATLSSLTRSLEYVVPFSNNVDTKSPIEIAKWRVENEVNRYFTQGVGYYFGQNDFAIRLQANDDMLWVVLGWLEGVKFVQLHAGAHYEKWQEQGASARIGDAWYGEQFVPAFAHRARIFYDLASRGWDTELCGGGMLWNNHMLPYKNAITNQLYISAAIGMYLYFPGDSNSSPFISYKHTNNEATDTKFDTERQHGPYNSLHLSDAVTAYDWLKNSGMTNDAGLYIDGFHIHNYGVNGTIGTGKCDEPDEIVWTYNQGVILSGLRGLWEATGNISYLEDGHRLVRNVIAATGWKLYSEPHVPPPSDLFGRWKWYGLGRAGVLEDGCDASGTCNQDQQTFKGIFFHHLTLFCEPLPAIPKMPGKTFGADKNLRTMHRQSCKEYAGWTAWNAKAALNTRDRKGVFGMWWALGAIEDGGEMVNEQTNHNADASQQALCDAASPGMAGWPRYCGDPNERGRGRTVETQGGGVAVLRAMWELVSMYDKEK